MHILLQVVGTALTDSSIPLNQVPLDKPTVLVRECNHDVIACSVMLCHAL
jgi:hypothetical protein